VPVEYYKTKQFKIVKLTIKCGILGYIIGETVSRNGSKTFYNCMMQIYNVNGSLDIKLNFVDMILERYLI
jgi:hypothetical protein